MNAPHPRPSIMRGTATPDVKQWTGIAGIVTAILMSAEFIVREVMGARPELEDADALGHFMARAADATLTIILIDTVLMATLIVFISGFRQIITHARKDLQWVADIGFAAGLAFVAITMVGDAMEAGAALDTVGQTPDPSVIRALTEGHMVMFGATGCVLLALASASSGYVILASGVLPRWTGWIAYAVGLSNLVAIPSLFGGTSDTAFFSAGGTGVAMIATFPWLVWVTTVALVTIRGPRTVAIRKHQQFHGSTEAEAARAVAASQA